MAIIDLDISELTMIYEGLKRAEGNLDIYYHDVSNILNTLNLKVASRQSIDDSLENIKRYIRRERDYIHACASMVNSVMDSFVANDSISGHLPEYSFSVSNVRPESEVIGVLPGGAMHGTPDPLAEEFEKIHLKMTEQAEQIFADSLTSSALADATEYIQYVQTAHTGLL